MFVGFQVFGSSATFAEVGAAAYLDRNRHRVLLLPLAMLDFFASTVAICDALARFYIADRIGRSGRRHWHKTTRFRTNGNGHQADADGGDGTRVLGRTDDGLYRPTGDQLPRPQ